MMGRENSGLKVGERLFARVYEGCSETRLIGFLFDMLVDCSVKGLLVGSKMGKEAFA